MRGRVVAVACTAALVMMLVPAAASAAPPADTNKNGGTVELNCEGNEVTIWVNFVASDRSGESPARVMTGIDSNVFKVASVSIGGAVVFDLRFPAPDPPFTLMECSHPSEWGTVTLVGAFIP